MSADDAQSVELPGADGAPLIKAIAEAANAGDGEALSGAIETLLASLPADPAAALAAAHQALGALQEARAFAHVATLAERLVRMGLDDAEVRRRYAQALVDSGRPTAALALLAPLTHQKDERAVPPAERAVALGVTGRAHKQIYVEGRRQTVFPEATAHLRHALAAYAAGSTQGSVKDRRWCMINLVALLMRGARDGTLKSGEAEARQLAERLIGELTRGNGLAALTQWDQATLGEAHIALGELQGAAHWYGRFAEDPRVTAFQLASAIRQLEEVWGLSIPSTTGGMLLAGLKTRLLGLSDGEIALSGPDRVVLGAMEATGAELEAVLGKDGPLRIGWLKAGIEAARAVGRIRDRLTGATYGTGFLVRGGDLRSDLGDAPLVVTNSHVVSGRPGAALGPDDAEIVFDEAAEAPQPLAFSGVVFEAAPDGLDTTVLKLASHEPRMRPLPIAPLDYLCDDIELLPNARRRAIIIGHADGRELAVSLADTEIVDLGYRDPARQGGLFVHYRTPTAPGSSGSPVFAPEQWQVAALHHAGPAKSRGLRRLSGKAGHHRANEGIAFASIARAMARVSRPVAIAAGQPRAVSTPVATVAAAPPERASVALPPVSSPEALDAVLKRLDIPEKDLRVLLEVDRSTSDAFAPQVVAKGGLTLPPGPERRKALDGAAAESVPIALVESLNAIARWRRQRAYAAKVAAGWTGLRLVAQGDSWFQYPFLVEDVIDHLFDEHAILDLSGAGRTLRDLGIGDELVHAVKSEVPNGVLLSGGGNDILGEHAIRLYLKDYAPGLPVADYAEPTLAAHLELIVSQYDRIVRLLHAVSPSLRIFCHGYDWAVPNAQKGDWLARPMAGKGIVEPQLQQGLVRLLIDRFNEAMRGLERRYPGRVLVVDCRGAVGPGRWYDELHPTDAGFADVAQRFRTRIAKAFDLAGS